MESNATDVVIGLLIVAVWNAYLIWKMRKDK